MSDCELNVLDLKKLLEANDSYKAGMTLIEMKQVYYSLKCKQALEAEGLYETGMSDQDIKDIYNTLKKSEETASNDNEYREIMNRTNSNCSNIDMLIDETDTMNEIENDNDIENENDNDENVDVTSVQSPIPKHQTSMKSFALVTKKQLLENINVLMENTSDHPLLKLPKVKYSNASILYYHRKEILKLSLNEREKAISQYLLNLNGYDKSVNKNKAKWGNPIEPCEKQQFNGDLFADVIPDLPGEDDEEEINDSFKHTENTSNALNETSYVANRPKRVVKRKSYFDQSSDGEEEDFTTPIKKTKSTDDINLNENSPESKLVKKKKKTLTTPKLPLYFSTGSERINKIFDKLKWDDNSTQKPEKKSNFHSLQDMVNLSDSDEDFFSKKDLLTTVNIHKEEDQIIKNKNCKTMKAKKALPKKRANINKLTVQRNSATKENESPEIPALNFYGNKSDVDESNNNKLETSSEELTNCPICNKPFHVSKIEVHASNCMQYEGKESETFCDICHEYIPDKKFQNHKYECLKKITEASTVVDKPVTRSQRNGFLCDICDKYIVNTNEIVHASNCISKV